MHSHPARMLDRPFQVNRMIATLLMLSFGSAVPGTALAKACDLDLQVVFLNPKEAFSAQAPVSILDALSLGAVSLAFGSPGESFVVETAMGKTRDAIAGYGLTGTVRQYPAKLSGRPYGWAYWDPAAPAQSQTVPYVPDLDDYWMLAIHLDDPGRAAVQVRRTSPTLLGLGKAFGADVRGMVYQGVFDSMLPDLASYNLRVLVNTGRGVRCPDVSQGY